MKCEMTLEIVLLNGIGLFTKRKLETLLRKERLQKILLKMSINTNALK